MTAVRAQRYSAIEADRWDRFVDTAANGTLMHTRRFLSYHPPDRFRDHSLMLLDHNDQVLALFPAAEVERQGQRVLQSHPGASYGGLVISPDATPELSEMLVGELIDYARAAGFDGIRMRLAERVFLRRSCDDLDAALFRAGFTIEARELSSALNLDADSRDGLLAQWTDMGRRNVRQATHRGAHARVCDDFPAYWNLLESTLKSRHQVEAATHSLEEILRLRQLLKDRILLVGGYHREQLISGAVIFIMNDVAAHTMYMAQNYDFQQLRSLNFVLFHAAELCRQLHLKYLNYGISSIPGSRGLEWNHGLLAFKRSCGGAAVLRDSLFLEISRP